jgi:phytoene dehydrogenase-like protein
MMRQAIHRDLDLGKHGLLIVPYLGTVNFADGDERLFHYHNPEALHLELKRHSPRDADAMHRFQADLTRYAQLIRKTLMRTPPDPTSFRPRDIMELLWLAKKFWALGERELYEYVRFFTMSAADFLEDYFENDLVKAGMASPGIIGTALGVYSPGSSYILLHHVMGDVDGSIGAWGLPRGGMGAISHSLAAAFQEHGGELRTNAGVQQVLVENRKAVGVVLENGDEIRARIVVSNLDAKRTFLRMTANTRSVAPPERSTSRCRACRRSPAFPTTAISTAAARALRVHWKPWSVPTTAGSAAAGPTTRSSKGSFLPPGTRRWRHRASTGCRISSSIAPRNSVPGHGRRRTAKNSAKRLSTRSLVTPRVSKT